MPLVRRRSRRVVALAKRRCASIGTLRTREPPSRTLSAERGSAAARRHATPPPGRGPTCSTVTPREQAPSVRCSRPDRGTRLPGRRRDGDGAGRFRNGRRDRLRRPRVHGAVSQRCEGRQPLQHLDHRTDTELHNVAAVHNRQGRGAGGRLRPVHHPRRECAREGVRRGRQRPDGKLEDRRRRGRLRVHRLQGHHRRRTAADGDHDYGADDDDPDHRGDHGADHDDCGNHDHCGNHVDSDHRASPTTAATTSTPTTAATRPLRRPRRLRPPRRPRDWRSTTTTGESGTTSHPHRAAD